jgi:hypothetical protein
MRLAEYLNSSYLVVDLYDADTRFLYGSTKLPLQELLRQGRNQCQMMKTAGLCSPDTSDDRGQLHFVVQNNGRLPKVEESKVEKGMRGQPT